ncbi:MAG: tyrosine--tRNA ligase, partial [Chloroflexota bacterium]
MRNAYDVLKERGFVEQVSDEAGLRQALEQPLTCYIGYDPTATSLHVGNLLTIMALAHMQREGHRPIVIVGGGTGMIGDPSGKTEMRQLLTPEQIAINLEAIKAQIGRYVDFGGGRALALNNADWLLLLNYIAFLREIGRHFSVNRMLAAESYRLRYEQGLSFIEFNYMLLQAYDFLHLYQECGCTLQMGGNDQWGNIVAGIDLIRRVTGGEA